jgi:hypothetical protein
VRIFRVTFRLSRVGLAGALIVITLVTSFMMSTPVGATVEFNAPRSAVCVGSTFEIGVWYQSSGGSHAYSVRVSDPSGKVVFDHRGNATTTWRMWNIRATHVGTYKTLYTSVSPKGHLTLRTLARSCRSTTTTTTTYAAAAPCTAAVITAAVKAFTTNFYKVDGYGCSGNFAYAFVTVTDQQGQPTAEVTDLFMAVNGAWQPADRGAYCVNGSVPADIYQNACQTN